MTDAAGRVLSVKQPDMKDVLMSQDAVGNLTSFTPADRQAQRFSYTAADELASYALPPLPGTSAETTTYDLDGLATGGTHGDASATTIAREPSGRVTRVATPWWTNDFSYTATTGQVQSLVRGTQRLEWIYDGFLMTREKATGIAPATSEWTYDSDFRVSSHSISGNNIALIYESDSLPTQAGLATAVYSPTTGQLTSVTVGNVVTTRTWNGHGELSTLTTAVGGVPLYSEGLSYDNAGRITVIEEVVEGTPAQWTYGYDTLGRLASAALNGGAPTTWTYDGSGNRLTENGVVATYDAQDRLVSSGAATYVWDGLGNRQSKSDASGTTRYVHDGLGALLSVTMPDASIVSYQYDGRQRRVARSVNGVATSRWVYDGQYRVAAEVDAAGVLTKRFVYLSQSNSPDYVLRGANTFALVKNHLGSVKLVIDSAGAVVQRLEYDALGNTQLDTAAGFQPFGFAGGLTDAMTKWVHFGYRDYDPLSALWTGRDPIRFQLDYLSPEPLLQVPSYMWLNSLYSLSESTYAYASNHPVNATDSTGLYYTAVICASPTAGNNGSIGKKYPGANPCRDCLLATADATGLCTNRSSQSDLTGPRLAAVANGKSMPIYRQEDCDCARLFAQEACRGVSPGSCPRDTSPTGVLACRER